MVVSNVKICNSYHDFLKKISTTVDSIVGIYSYAINAQGKMY